MTTQVKIELGTISVDLTNLGVQVTHRFSNPIIVFDTPRVDLNTSNSVGINIGFITEAFDLRFTLTDGLGSMDYASPTTNYEKLFSMAYKVNPKTFKINDKTMTVHIENINLPWVAGQKDLSIDGSMSVRVVKNLLMQDSALEGAQYVATFTNGSAYIIVSDAEVHFSKGSRVVFATAGTLPTPFSGATKYWVVNVSPTAVWVSTAKNGEPVSATSAGAGSHTIEVTL